MTKDSRLEKFLKALCSLDYSDLPTPLSRVEVLWNCLITGEATPDFQPQSRTEKYLMTILGVYDLEDIPKPISRAETLLYKLATGDTDVELEDGAKSRYELLLSEIVANGGVGGNVDFEYITYVLSESFNTLYNTVEKPVKSAILKGSTKYRDIDTGDILDTFDETKNLELVSVKMPVLTTTGKNLFDVNGEKELSCFYSATLNGYRSEHNDVDTYTIKIKPNTEYFLTCEGLPSMSHITYWDENLSYIGAEPVYGDNLIKQITSPQGAKYMRLPIHKEGVLNIQIEEGSATPYEPYKSNILTVNEDITLRGFGNVRDELNLLTGELIQRVGEIVLDGVSVSLTMYKKTDEFITGILSYKFFDDIIGGNGGTQNTSIIGDSKRYLTSRFSYNQYAYEATGEGRLFDPSANLFFCISKSKLSTFDIDGFNRWLSQNPIKIIYQLATESVKTVDLTTLDQDGKETELKTFNDITHVSLSSEGLIPEAEMTVATKNLDDISQTSTMSLRMNDISDRQNELQNEVDTQSKNIDSTMMATTEIYEQTL